MYRIFLFAILSRAFDIDHFAIKSVGFLNDEIQAQEQEFGYNL